MKRNIRNLIADYDRKMPDVFRVSDFRELEAIAKEAGGNNPLYDAITAALKVGYMTGYRHGKTIQQNKRKPTSAEAERAGKQAVKMLAPEGKAAYKELSALVRGLKIYAYKEEATSFFIHSDDNIVEFYATPNIPLEITLRWLLYMVKNDPTPHGNPLQEIRA